MPAPDNARRSAVIPYPHLGGCSPGRCRSVCVDRNRHPHRNRHSDHSDRAARAGGLTMRERTWTRTGRRTIRAMGAFVLAIAATGALAVHPAAAAGGNGLIAFSSFADGEADIYTMNADGTNAVNITNKVGADNNPAWSPDGTKIAFGGVADVDGVNTSWIFTMNADGTDLVNLTNGPGAPPCCSSVPDWSPDGTKIVYEGNGAIWTMNADGTGQKSLTEQGNNGSPAWSPDGKQI